MEARGGGVVLERTASVGRATVRDTERAVWRDALVFSIEVVGRVSLTLELLEDDRARGGVVDVGRVNIGAGLRTGSEVVLKGVGPGPVPRRGG